jgi:hypothetical protein
LITCSVYAAVTQAASDVQDKLQLTNISTSWVILVNLNIRQLSGVFGSDPCGSCMKIIVCNFHPTPHKPGHDDFNVLGVCEHLREAYTHLRWIVDRSKTISMDLGWTKFVNNIENSTINQ